MHDANELLAVNSELLRRPFLDGLVIASVTKPVGHLFGNLTSNENKTFYFTQLAITVSNMELSLVTAIQNIKDTASDGLTEICFGTTTSLPNIPGPSYPPA